MKRHTCLLASLERITNTFKLPKIKIQKFAGDPRYSYEANEAIKRLCGQRDFIYIENNQITKYQLCKDSLHTNFKGLSTLTNNFICAVNYFFTNFFYDTKG